MTGIVDDGDLVGKQRRSEQGRAVLKLRPLMCVPLLAHCDLMALVHLSSLSPRRILVLVVLLSFAA